MSLAVDDGYINSLLDPPGPRYARAMELTQEDIDSFIEMWRRAFGQTLTPERARSEANRLLDFFLTLAEARVESTGADNASCDTISI